MTISKKEISILIEIFYSVVFALVFLPYFYENQNKNLILMDGLTFHSASHPLKTNKRMVINYNVML